MLPKLTHQERQSIKDDKRTKVLTFLGSGEVYSTADIIADLLKLSRPRAIACLNALERDHYINSELVKINARNVKVFGVTAHGLSVVDACGNPHFEIGRNNPSSMQHKLDGQRMRIKAENAGWTNWIPERIARNLKLKKIPDAIATDPKSNVIAIEIERFAKTPKRYAEVIVTYLLEIKAGKYHEVHYVSPTGVSRLIQNSFAKIEYVKVNGQKVKLTEKHLAKFKFFEFNNWIKP